MTGILLTQYDGAILGPIAKLLGYLMNAIYIFLDNIGFPNIGLAIIIFTIVIYMLLLPLTIKQQKFSKLSAKMNPEIQAIQAKYKGRKDNESTMAMNQETQAVYAKYGVSPTGSCVQLIIQMPILMALYRVIYAVPAYVGRVKDVFSGVVDSLYAQSNIAKVLNDFESAKYFTKQIKDGAFLITDEAAIKNTIIDFLNRASTTEWSNLAATYPDFADKINNTYETIKHYNNFLGLNIANSPSFTVKAAWGDKDFLLLIGAIMIPVLSALTQWINTKLMPQPDNKNAANDQMTQTMKSMNVMMPLMSAFFCYSLPIGLGIYWIAGAVIRCIQQVIINKHIDKMDIEEIIEKNKDKAAKKLEKQKQNAEKMSSYANMNTRSMNSISNIAKSANNEADSTGDSTGYVASSSNAKSGSIASKANLVKQYNENKN